MTRRASTSSRSLARTSTKKRWRQGSWLALTLRRKQQRGSRDCASRLATASNATPARRCGLRVRLSSLVGILARASHRIRLSATTARSFSLRQMWMSLSDSSLRLEWMCLFSPAKILLASVDEDRYESLETRCTSFQSLSLQSGKSERRRPSSVTLSFHVIHLNVAKGKADV